MSWSDLSLAKKIVLPIAVLSTLLAVLSAIQIATLNSISSNYSHINEKYLPALQLVLNADRDLYQAQIAERTMALGNAGNNFRTMHKENLDQVATRLGKVAASDISPEAKAQAQKFLQAFARWRPKTEKLVGDVSSGQLSFAQSAELSTGSLDQEFESIRDVLDVLGEMLGKEAESLQLEAQQAQSSAMTTIFTLVAVALVIAIAVGITFPKLITDPVNQLSAVLGQMADGRGDLTTRMPRLGNDEIGKMAHNFNRFISGMQQMIGNIQQVADTVGGASDHLKNSSDASRRISSEYANVMDTVATANHEMGLAIQEVSSNTQQVSEEAKSADQAARVVSTQFRQAMNEIQSLAENVNNSGDVIQELVAETTNIASVLDVIKGIAEQTNLLALNAAIEAARAGEQGRGFAVVADEVRTLASKTQQSTGDINVMIEKLRAGVSRAVETMDESQQKAEKTVEYASQSETSIQNISGAMVSISDRILQVASAIEEQTSVINTINENLVAAKDLSSDGSRSTDEIAHSVDGLHSQANTLKSAVGNFRV
jgi:methyl-accepting chemotaxis protein